MTHCAHFFNLPRDERGSTAIIFALILVPLMGALGMAVDGARWYSARQSTSGAIDSAVLAGARMLQVDPDNPGAALQMAASAYTANTAGRGRVKTDTIKFVLTDSNSALSVDGNAYLKTSFLGIVGISELPLISTASSRVAKATLAGSGSNSSNIEVSVMLDVTGSMCDDGQGPCASGAKLDGLKDAARELVKIVVQDNQSRYASRVALVPFSTRVRVDRDNSDGTLMKKLTNLEPKWSGWIEECISSTGSGGGETAGNWTCLQTGSRYKSNWKIYPCVTERVYGTSWNANDQVDYTDDAPSAGRWLNAHGGDRSPFFLDSSDSKAVASDRGSAADKPASHWNYGSSVYCSDVPDGNAVLPLTADKTALKDRIGQFQAGGATGGVGGTAWAWYMLSPKWSSIWTGLAQPGSYSDVTAKQASGAPVLRKVAVLMTDGVYNSLRGNKEQDPAMVSSHAKKICAAMQVQKIEIFTVGFALDKLSGSERSVAEDMLKSCGTDLSHFYSTLTVADLKAAFRDIAMKVSPVRLTQ
jgi:Flp pilus assembly protein TadG